MLSVSEKIKLQYFIQDHPQLIVFNLDQEQILAWLLDTPSANIKNAFATLTFEELSNFFKEQNFTKWYSLLALKIHNNTCLVPEWTNMLTIKQEMLQLMGELVDMKILDITIQNIAAELITRDRETLTLLLKLFVVDELFSDLTLWRLSIEFAPHPRYLSIGLSQQPVLDDLKSNI